MPVPALRIAELRCRTVEPWAQDGRIAWVRDHEAHTGLHPVERVIPLCAELLPLSREEQMKDWIDEGSSTVYYRWLGYVAQSPLSSGRPSDH